VKIPYSIMVKAHVAQKNINDLFLCPQLLEIACVTKQSRPLFEGGCAEPLQMDISEQHD